MRVKNDDFYVGYLPKAPATLAGFVKRVVIGLAAGLTCVALALVFAQAPFAKSTFEFGQFKTYQGQLIESPYPMLQGSHAQYLLVGPGKHGADSFVRMYDRAVVEMKGSRIERDGRVMLEVQPESVRAMGAAANYPLLERTLGEITLTGEIVDSKCHLGVMNPGNGKVHRDCAVRCISGGVPPAFIAKDAKGETAFMLLAGPVGEPIGSRVLDYVAEPIRVHGVLTRTGDVLVLRADPARFRRLTE